MHLHPYIMAIMVMLFFSGNFIVGRALEGTVAPFTLSFLRFMTAVLVLLPFCFKTIYKKRALWLKEWKPLLYLTLSGIVLFNASLYLAVNFTTSINASILNAINPAATAFLSFLVLKEKLLKTQTFGIILSFAGVLWIITEGSFSILMTLSFNIGDMIMLFGILCWAVYSINIKQHSYKFPVMAGVTVTMIAGALILLPVAVVESAITGVPPLLEWHIAAGLLYIGIFPSAVALMLWYRSIEEIGPAKASIFFNLIPVFTTVMAVTFLDEVFTIHHLTGGLIALSGVYISAKKTLK